MSQIVTSRIDYSPTGRPADREPWAAVEMTRPLARREAARLLVDLDDRFGTRSRRPAVWLDGVRLSPSADDVDRERRRLAAFRESGDVQAA